MSGFSALGAKNTNVLSADVLENIHSFIENGKIIFETNSNQKLQISQSPDSIYTITVAP